MIQRAVGRLSARVGSLKRGGTSYQRLSAKMCARNSITASTTTRMFTVSLRVNAASAASTASPPSANGGPTGSVGAELAGIDQQGDLEAQKTHQRKRMRVADIIATKPAGKLSFSIHMHARRSDGASASNYR